MIQVSKVVLGILLLMGVWSCSNDFDLIEGEVNIPIVYGLLDAKDTAHYIRVEKAFVDPTIPATQLAQDPNQLYYDNAVVRLVNVESKESFTLTRVDGNLEGYVRQEGAFASSPNYLYKIQNDDINLEEEQSYRLEVEIPGEETVTGTTFIVEQTSSISPNSSASNGTSISFPVDRTINLSWSRANGGVLSTGVMVIRYSELIDGELTDKSIEWNIFKNTDKNNAQVFGQEFYELLASNIDVVEGAKRYFLGIDYRLSVGGEEIQDFLNVAQANLGITSSGEIPNFSNLSRGRGLFSSRSHIDVLDIQLRGETQDLLRTNPITEALNFQ